MTIRAEGARGSLYAFWVMLAFTAVSADSLHEIRAQQSAPAVSSPGILFDAELRPRGERVIDTIKFSAWEKTCFRSPNSKMVCRTSTKGEQGNGKSPVRVDLIEREGDPHVRLQLMLPVGLYLQAESK